MSNFYYYLFFGIYPYTCLTIFVIGTFTRYDQKQYSWKDSSNQILADKGLKIGNIILHIGVMFFFFWHLTGLLTSYLLYNNLITAEQKQLLTATVGGLAGIVSVIGLTILLYRRIFVRNIRATSSIIDIMILFILWIQIILSLIEVPFSLEHYNSTTTINLSEWVQYIITFHITMASEYIKSAGWLFQIHLILGQTILLLFPFTRLVYLLGALIRYVSRLYQIV